MYEFLFTVFLLIYIIFQGDSTTNAKCIAFSECEAAVIMVRQRRNDPETVKLLRSAHCGYSREAYVWCDIIEEAASKLNPPIGTPATPATPATPTPTPVTSANTELVDDADCVTLINCPEAINEILNSSSGQTVEEVLKKAYCGIDGTVIKVVCKIFKEPTEDEKPVSNRVDVCVNLSLCPEAMTLVMNKTIDESIEDILGESYCGINGTVIQVICDKVPKQREETFVRHDDDCVTINNCPLAVELVNNSTTNETIEEILGNAFCGMDGTVTTVICDKVLNSTFRKMLPNPFNKECGIPSSAEKLFGGESTSIDDFPWMALINYNRTAGVKNYSCHGTLINSRFILTAAHCLDESQLRSKRLPNPSTITLGEYDTTTDIDCNQVSLTRKDCADPIKEYRIEKFVVHSGFDQSVATENDIGLIKLTEDVKFTDFIRPICLPERQVDLSKEIFWVCGWGRIETARRSTVKLKAKVPFVPLNECKKDIKIELTDKVVCAGIGDGSDTCNGDSGGPLMREETIGQDFITFQTGVVSFGVRSCGSGPAIYTYVPKYINWIRQTMAGM